MSGRRNTPRIDREKVRAHARKLDGTGLLVWLDRAIDMLPDEVFPELIADYQMDVILDSAREAATPEQREALEEYEDDLRRRR